jgi:hypothetical protein
VAGTQYVPSAANTLFGVNVGTTTGTYVAPTAAQLVYGQSCGVSGSVAGTQYVPSAANTLFGVNVGTTTGTYVAPTAAQVESGVYFGPGSSYLGTYAGGGGGGGTYPAAAYVHTDAGPYGPNGNDYTPALSALANWCTIAGITWPSPLQVDGGVFYGPVTGTEYEGTGVNASTITAAIQTALTTIGLVQSQATNGGLLVLITGDDYTIATNRPETWSGHAWANLSGATISLVIKEASTGTVAATIAGTVVTAGTGTQTVQVQVPNAITGTLTPGGPGVYRYKVIATWPGPIVQTLALGPVSVMD